MNPAAVVPPPPVPQPAAPPAPPAAPAPKRAAPKLKGPAPAPAFKLPTASPEPDSRAPVAAGAPRKPVSAALVAGLIGGAVILTLAGAGGYWWLQRNRTPDAAAIRAAVEQALGNPGLRVTEVAPTITPQGSDAADILYHATAELKEPLYVAADTNAVLRDQLKLDAAAWQKARDAAAGKDSARILELAGLQGVDDTLLRLTLLKESSPKGAKLTFSGQLHATKGVGGWKVEPAGGRPAVTLPPGQPRAKFSGHLCVVSDAAEIDHLRELARSQAEVPAKIERGRLALAEERRGSMEKILAGLLAQLTPGALFAGSASGPGQAEQLYLEITDVQEGGRQITALLRNRGGWGDARVFRGSCAADPDAGALNFTLSTRRDQAVKQGGPFLERNENWEMALSLKDGQLTGRSGDSEFGFTRLGTAEAAAAKGELDQEAAALRAVTANGKAYRGTVRAKSGADAHEYLMRFSRVQPDSATVGMTLEPLGRGTWRRSFRGTVIGNTFRAAGWPLRLETFGRDAVKSASGFAPLTMPGDYTVTLKLAEGRLTGESRDLRWDFAVSAAEETGPSVADVAALKKRVFAMIKSGASFTGRAQAAEGGDTERIRVRFTLVDQRSGTVEALLESLETSGVNREFRGTADLIDGRLVLTSYGATRGRPGRGVRLPALVDSGADATLSVAVEGDTISADVGPAGWKLEF